MKVSKAFYSFYHTEASYHFANLAVYVVAMISIRKFETCEVGGELRITDSSCDLKMIIILNDWTSFCSYLHTRYILHTLHMLCLRLLKSNLDEYKTLCAPPYMTALRRVHDSWKLLHFKCC